MSIHPVVLAASEGRLPEWAKVTQKRRMHIERVAVLLGEWADEIQLDSVERVQWLAAGWLHDSLKDERSRRLRKIVKKRFKKLPGPVLHGPAAAELLRNDGVEDQEILLAVENHTLGHAKFGRPGMALYAADCLEPGRRVRRKWRTELREQMPENLDAVVLRIVRDRMTFLVQKGRPLHPQTVKFWNRLVRGGS